MIHDNERRHWGASGETTRASVARPGKLSSLSLGERLETLTCSLSMGGLEEGLLLK